VEVKKMSSKGLVTLRYSDRVRNVSAINETILDIKVRQPMFDEGQVN